MSLDDRDLYPVRRSLVDMRAKAFERFEEMAPLELAMYFKSGMNWPTHENSGTERTDLSSLQHLINFYVETREEEFKEEYMGYLNGDNRPDKMEETGLGIPARWAIQNSIIDMVRSKSEIEHLEENKSLYITDEEITPEEFLNTMNRRAGVIFHSPLGYRDDIGFMGLAERVHTERIRVAKKMVWKSQGKGNEEKG